MADFKTLDGLVDYFTKIGPKQIDQLASDIFFHGEDIYNTLNLIDSQIDYLKMQKAIIGLINFVNIRNCLFLAGVIHTMYSIECKVQNKENKTYHKGLILYTEGLMLYESNKTDKGIRFITLALIEDIIHMKNGLDDAIKSNAFRFLATSVYDEPTAKKITYELNSRIQKFNTDIYYPEDVLNHNDQMEVLPGIIDELFSLNHIQYQELFEEFQKSSKKGKNLENLIKNLFASVSGLQFMKKNLFTKSPELDLVYRISGEKNPFYGMFGQYLVIECKDWKEKVGAKEIRSIVINLQSLDLKGGIFVTKNGISGKDKEEFLYSEYEIMTAYHRHGITIVILEEEDLKKIGDGENLISLLFKRYEKTRFSLKKTIQ